MAIFRASPQVVINAQSLTGSYVNSQPLSVEGWSDMVVEITYTTGAAETNNILDIQMLTASGLFSDTNGSENVTDLYYVTSGTDNSGIITLSPDTWQYTGASAATAYKYSFTTQLQDKFIVFSVKEEGVAANFGTITLKVILVNKYQ